MTEGKLTIFKEAFMKIDEQVKKALAELDGVTVPFPSGASTFDSPMPVTHIYDKDCERFGGPEKYAEAIVERTIGTPTANPMFVGSWNDNDKARAFVTDHPELFPIFPFPEKTVNPDKFGA